MIYRKEEFLQKTEGLDINSMFHNLASTLIERNPVFFSKDEWYKSFYPTDVGFGNVSTLNSMSFNDFETSKMDWVVYNASKLKNEMLSSVGILMSDPVQMNNEWGKIFLDNVEEIAKDSLFHHIDCSKEEMVEKMEGLHRESNTYNANQNTPISSFTARVDLTNRNQELLNEFMEFKGWVKEGEKDVAGLSSGKMSTFSKEFSSPFEMQQEIDYVTYACLNINFLKEEMNKENEVQSKERNPFDGFELY